MHARRKTRASRAYSLIEVLITVLIIQIISTMVVVNISDVEAAERTDRAAQEVVVALRYARMLAMTSGQTCGVEFDTVNQRVRVFQGNSFTTVNNNLAGGPYIIRFTSKPGVSGVRLTTALISGTTGSPYRILFGSLGGTTNNGYVTLSYGHAAKNVQIPLTGDPTVQ